jgi:hypothetical protein
MMSVSLATAPHRPTWVHTHYAPILTTAPPRATMHLMEWAIWLTIALTLLVFPLGRRLLGLLWSVSFGLLFLLFLSEPDLSE